MILSMGFNEIEKFKMGKQAAYKEIIHYFTELKICSANELNGFFVFVKNFYNEQ